MEREEVIYNEGWSAYDNGNDICPYEDMAPESAWWWSGWDAAKDWYADEPSNNWYGDEPE